MNVASGNEHAVAISDEPGAAPPARVLYVTWNGPGQNYLVSHYLPIFTTLRERDVEVSVIQFHWYPEDVASQIADTMRRSGLRYEAIRINRGFGGLRQAFTLFQGGLRLRSICQTWPIDLVMPRSLLPGAVTRVAHALGLTTPILFDADGLMADERAEFGGWKTTGLRYRSLRYIERWLLHRARGTMVRTEAARQVLQERAGPTRPGGDIEVIGNAKDEHVFDVGTADSRLNSRKKLGIPAGVPVMVYSGTLGEQYRPDWLPACFRSVLRFEPSAVLLLLTAQQDIAVQLLTEAAIDPHRFRSLQTGPAEIPAMLAAADLGLAFRRPSFSQQGVAPIKVAEYLLCGLPVLYSGPAAGLERMEYPSCAALGLDAENPDFEAAARWFREEVLSNRERARASARSLGLRHFSMEAVTGRMAGMVWQALEDAAGRGVGA